MSWYLQLTTVYDSKSLFMLELLFLTQEIMFFFYLFVFWFFFLDMLFISVDACKLEKCRHKWDEGCLIDDASGYFHSLHKCPLFSTDSGSCGQMRQTFATSEAGIAVAAWEAAGSLVAPTWVWTTSSWRSWRLRPHLRSLLPARSWTCAMASLCCSLGSGLLLKKLLK